MTSLNKTVRQATLTWFILAIVVGHSIYTPNYQPIFGPSQDFDPEYSYYYLISLSILFGLFELLNFLCHSHFEDVLREVIEIEEHEDELYS